MFHCSLDLDYPGDIDATNADSLSGMVKAVAESVVFSSTMQEGSSVEVAQHFRC